MNDYHFGPLALASELQLPELCEIVVDSPATHGTVNVKVDDAGLVADFNASHTDDRSGYALMIDQDGTATMRHDNAVDFILSPLLDHVTVRATSAVDESTVRHLLIDQVLPRVLEARGAFVMHASGVETDRGGVLFLGDSGSGKSSLAAGFERSGARLLGDDCFTVEIIDNAISAATTYPSLRLLPDAISEFTEGDSVALSEVGAWRPKRRVDQDRRLPPEPGVIDAIFVIDLDTDHTGPTEAHRLSARHGIQQLLANSFRFNSTGENALQSLSAAEAILQHVALYDLRYERRYDQLDQVVAAIMAMPELDR